MHSLLKINVFENNSYIWCSLGIGEFFPPFFRRFFFISCFLLYLGYLGITFTIC